MTAAGAVNDVAQALDGETRGALQSRLEPELARRHIVLDAEQDAALRRLQRLYDDLIEFRNARRSLVRWLRPPIPPRGV